MKGYSQEKKVDPIQPIYLIDTSILAKQTEGLPIGLNRLLKLENGMGIDVTTPLDPQIKDALNKPKIKNVLKAERSFKFSQVNTVAEEESSFSLYFSGNAFGVNLKAALAQAQKNFEANDIFYIELNEVTGGSVLDGPLTLPKDALKGKTPEEQLKNFISTYGTHYVDGVLLGKKIIIRVSVKKQKNANAMEMSAALNVHFIGGNAEAEAKAAAKKTLSQNFVEISATIIGGEINAKDAILNGLDKVDQWIKDYNDGKNIVKPTAITYSVRSYESVFARDPAGQEIVKLFNAQKRFVGDADIKAAKALLDGMQQIKTVTIDKQITSDGKKIDDLKGLTVTVNMPIDGSCRIEFSAEHVNNFEKAGGPNGPSAILFHLVQNNNEKAIHQHLVSFPSRQDGAGWKSTSFVKWVNLERDNTLLS